MKRFLPLFFLLSALISLPGCSYTSAVSLTNTPADRTQPIEVSVKKNIFLGFNFDNDQALTLVTKLKEKCPGGDVKGILTKDVTTLYVLTIFWARETIASGYCIKSKSVADTIHSLNDGIEVSQWEESLEVEE